MLTKRKQNALLKGIIYLIIFLNFNVLLESLITNSSVTITQKLGEMSKIFFTIKTMMANKF